jgi:hypothetical protein
VPWGVCLGQGAEPREPFAGGGSFGNTEPYERLFSKAHFADVLSLLRYEAHDAAGNPNPLACHVEKVYGTGASLSGRVIREYVYEGWNIDAAGRRVFDAVHTHTGSFVPFARTKAEREARGDPRPSSEERYSSHAAYIAAVTRICEELVRGGLMLQEDAERFSAAARQKNRLDASVRLGPLIQAGAYTGR